MNDEYRLYHGDCLEVMSTLEAGSVDLIVVDPPYHKVKRDTWWDMQHDTRQGFLSWIGDLCQEWKRILAPNGSLYVFASPQMSAHVEVKIGEVFNVLNCIRWHKPSDNSERRHVAQILDKGLDRAFYPTGERIIFAENYNSDNIALGESGYDSKCDELRGFVFEPLRAYLDGERKRAGLSVRDVAVQFQKKTGSRTVTGMAGHWFTSVQWTLPTEENHTWLKELFNNSGGDFLRREYEDLRREYEDLRREYEDLRREYEDLRRPFYASKERPYTDVWDFPTVSNYSGKHPCEKPIRMIDHIVKTSSRDRATVLDCFMGSGVAGVSCARLGRKFVGVELDNQYYKSAERKVVAAYGGNVWSQPTNKKEIATKRKKTQLPLFMGTNL